MNIPKNILRNGNVKIRTGNVFIVKGIYAYSDTKYDSYCYVGKDSHIDEGRRDYRHNHSYYYDEQPINRILQNNRERYDYVKLVELSDDFTDDDLSNLESLFINELNTYHYENPYGFNFTKGGEGSRGYKFSEEHRRKLSKNNARYWLGKKFSEEHCRHMSESKKGENFKPYARVVREGVQNGKQVFGLWHNGNRLKRSINYSKLKIEADLLNEELN